MRAFEWQEDSERHLFPTDSPPIKPSNIRTIESNFARTFIIGDIRTPHQGYGVAAAKERVTQPHNMSSQATELTRGNVLTNQENSHRTTARVSPGMSSS